MNVIPKPAFLRHIGKISNQTIRDSVDSAILSVMSAPTIREIPTDTAKTSIKFSLNAAVFIFLMFLMCANLKAYF